MYAILNSRNWKNNDFTYVGAYFYQFCVISEMCFSVVPDRKRNQHLSVAWNVYLFDAITKVHHMNTEMELNHTSSISPMLGMVFFYYYYPINSGFYRLFDKLIALQQQCTHN